MANNLFLKILMIHFFAIRLAYASTSSWAYQQIETDKAQELVRGRGSNVTVALIDTGLDTTHEELKKSLWVNPGEIPDNGIDDDGNGYVDDVHGWNFVTNSNDLSDQEGHGTHIGGIIHDVAPQAKLMVLKYYDPKKSNETNVQNTLRAFQYAVKMKAQLINLSGGGPGFNPDEYKILQEAQKRQILLVAAAGNNRANTDRIKYYPADYPLNNILSVTAIDQNFQLASFANFGTHTVQVAAPGENIRSSLPGGQYGEMSGTSQATAFVSGVAALLLSQNPLLSTQTLVRKILAGSVSKSSLQGKTQYGSSLNALRSLSMKSPVESAAGFVFSQDSQISPKAYTISSSLLDPSSSLGQGENQ